jgi:hypothetical protein
MDEGLARLLDEARRSRPSDRIGWRDRIAAHGDEAIAAVAPWVADATLGAFAVRVIEAAARSSGDAAAIGALLDALPSAATPPVADDIEVALARLGYRRRAPRARTSGARTPPAPGPAGPARYMQPWEVWHLVVADLATPGGTGLQTACHRWNSEAFILRSPGRLRERLPGDGFLCPVCDASQDGSHVDHTADWEAEPAEWLGDPSRLHLRRDSAWHLGVGDGEISSEAFGPVFLTECGWWIERDRVRRVSRAFEGPHAPICRNCGFYAGGASDPEPEAGPGPG